MPVERLDSLAPGAAAEVLALADAAAGADGTFPLDEHVVLDLRRGGDPGAVHLLARDADGRVIGYAHLEPAVAEDPATAEDPAAGATGELVVHPRARRRGVGARLASAALAWTAGRLPRGRLRVWAHGDHPGSRALARRLGFRRDRVLLRLRRGLDDALPAPALPDGVRLRPFQPGQDEAAWLAVNARAFAGHPEQGRWTERDLRLRMAEPWFDPAGFLLAVRGDALLGFHWTKIHGGTHDGGDAARAGPVGEVYVVGVDPTAHGLGLGTALTLAGLRHLRGRGLDRVMLYVDESNPAAVALYTRLGFTHWAADVMYAGPASGPTPEPVQFHAR